MENHMKIALWFESIIWGGVENIPPVIRRRLGGYDTEPDDVEQVNDHDCGWPDGGCDCQKVIHRPKEKCVI